MVLQYWMRIYHVKNLKKLKKPFFVRKRIEGSRKRGNAAINLKEPFLKKWGILKTEIRLNANDTEGNIYEYFKNW